MATHNKKIELKNLEFPIRNHLQDKSPTLINFFMICGYEDIYINEQIIKDIELNLDFLKIKIIIMQKQMKIQIILLIIMDMENIYAKIILQFYHL